MRKVPNIFGPLSYFWQYPNMVHWHVAFYVMFVYCTFMKVCMQKKKKFEEEFFGLLLMTFFNYCYRIDDYT